VAVRIGLDDGAFVRARQEIAASHDGLRRGAMSLCRSAGELLEGWRGVAAGQYARAWEEWEQGTGRVLASLLDLTRAMDLARAELEASDDEAAGRAAYLRARLEARP
jgi:uncharacterized protein YukE